MKTRRLGLVLAFAVGAAAAACGRATPIPPGAQVIVVRVDGPIVTLEPPVARAGDVYLAVEAPPGSSLSFVEGKPTADGPAGPLTESDLVRLVRGETEAMSVTGFEPGGCSESQDAMDYGMVGPCGNVMHVVVVPGKYALLVGAPDADPGPTSPAVLEVVP